MAIADERCQCAGTFVGSSYLYATPRHLARFGQLLLHDGCWDGERILPAGWVAWSTEVTPGIRAKALGRSPGDVQGRHFWLNRPVPEAGQDEPPWPSVPQDLFAAKGRENFYRHLGFNQRPVDSPGMVFEKV